MLTTPAVITQFAAAGIALRVLPNGKVGASPKGRITDDLRQVVDEHRAPLVADLVANEVLADLADADQWSEPARRAAFDANYQKQLLALPDERSVDDVRSAAWRAVVAARRRFSDWVPAPPTATPWDGWPFATEGSAT